MNEMGNLMEIDKGRENENIQLEESILEHIFEKTKSIELVVNYSKMLGGPVYFKALEKASSLIKHTDCPKPQQCSYFENPLFYIHLCYENHKNCPMKYVLIPNSKIRTQNHKKYDSALKISFMAEEFIHCKIDFNEFLGCVQDWQNKFCGPKQRRKI